MAIQTKGLGIYSQHGFTLEPEGPYIIALNHDAELVGYFSQIGATEESIQEACENHLANCHG